VAVGVAVLLRLVETLLLLVPQLGVQEEMELHLVFLVHLYPMRVVEVVLEDTLLAQLLLALVGLEAVVPVQLMQQMQRPEQQIPAAAGAVQDMTMSLLLD
jgi:hypothetical protein